MSLSPGRRAASIRCRARISTTGRRHCSTSPPGTFLTRRSWMTGSRPVIPSRRSGWEFVYGEGRMAERQVLAIVLAGGAGKRLAPLTADRAKPAVPFGGLYRLIDFALSNLVNAGCRRICVLTQYKSHSLDRHITTTWRLSSLLGNYVTPVPAQQRLGPHWYTGSADAIYPSLHLISAAKPAIVAVFGADHVYRMDMMQMVHH